MKFKGYLAEAPKTDREVILEIKNLAAQLKDFKDTEAIIKICNKILEHTHGAALPPKSERGTRNT